MINSTHIAAMLELQAGMNAKVNPGWLDAGYPFLRAIVIEGAEGMEHHGWKWWKAQQLDLAQLQMELVDIWHFALSHYVIQDKGDLNKTGASIQVHAKALSQVAFDGNTYELESLDTLSKLELLIGLATVRRFSIPLFEALLTDCKMTWDELYLQYVSKNVLNFFRQDNGYKQGTYKKVWDGREDNEHLVEIVSSLDTSVPEFDKNLYENLAKRYASLTSN